MSQQIHWKIFIQLIFGAFLLSQYTMAEEYSQNSTWVSLGPEGGPVNSIILDPSNSDILYMAPDGYPCRIHKSTNKGDTWNELSVLNSSVSCLTIDPNNPSILIAVSYDRFMKSENGGITWDNVYFQNHYFYGVMVDPNDFNIIHCYGQCRIGNVSYTTYFKSDDGGISWSNYQPETTSDYTHPYCLAVDPTNRNVVYLAGLIRIDQTYYTKLYKSTNGGTDWNDISPGNDDAVYDILINPSTPNKVYTVGNTGIHRSSDGGSTWHKNNGWAYGDKLAQDPNDSDILYAGAYNLFFKSTDGGMNWSLYMSGLYGGAPNGLIVDGGTPNILYFANRAGFFKSIDNGEHWYPSNSHFIATKITHLRHVPSSPNILYAGSENSGLFKTTNAIGKELVLSPCDWENVLEFKGETISAIEYVPGDPGMLYVAMQDG